MVFHTVKFIAPALVLLSFAGAAQSAVIFSENFESGTLDSRLSVQTTGGFIVSPGIQDMTGFGSNKAFGFGLSNCRFSCFSDHVTSLSLTFAAPVFVGDLSFREMERFGNWGSDGNIVVDGVFLTGTGQDFGHLPYNEGGPDTTFRTHVFSLNKSVTQITLRVGDITDLSEIFVDDLQVTDGSGSGSAVPEPTTACLILTGIVAIISVRRRLR